MGRVCDRFPADTSSESTALRLKAFESAYNLDYDEAVAALNRAIALDPSNLANQRALAGITWLQTLFRRGAVIIDFYVCGSFKPRVKMEKPPPDLAEQFETHAATVLELSEQLAEAKPRDPSALYELGATVGLIASYRASVQGEVLDALRAAPTTRTPACSSWIRSAMTPASSPERIVTWSRCYRGPCGSWRTSPVSMEAKRKASA